MILWHRPLLLSPVFALMPLVRGVPEEIPEPQTPILVQKTLGSVGDISQAHLELKSRFVYEVDVADLVGDSNPDLLESHFYLFDPPLSEDQPVAGYRPVKGTGGIRIFENASAMKNLPVSHHSGGGTYATIPGQFLEVASNFSWAGGLAPSVRDAEVADVDKNGLVDIVLSCGIGVGLGDIDGAGLNAPKGYLMQNRLLLQGPAGVFTDRTFGNDGIPNDGGGTGLNRDRFPVMTSNSCGVDIEDVNGDGHPDIVFGQYGNNFTGAKNLLMLNDSEGQGYFTKVVLSDPGHPGGPTADVELADIDNDNDFDLVVANANPFRIPVFNDQGGVFALNENYPKFRNEIWENDNGVLTYIGDLPEPAHGLTPNTASRPYDDAGFFDDTRAICLLDADNDQDLEVMFVNSGWVGDEPGFHSHVWRDELPGQSAQFLLNENAPQSLDPLSFHDVAHQVLPFGVGPVDLDHNTTSMDEWRPLTDAEAEFLGAPEDLILNGNGGFKSTNGMPRTTTRTGPNTHNDDYIDLVVAAGPMAQNEVWINNENWSFQNGDCTGRFLRASWGIAAGETGWQSPLQSETWKDLQVAGTGGPVMDFGPPDRFYTHDIDVADLDGDWWPDIVTADGDPRRGEVLGLYYYRGVGDGFRWHGQSDEGHFLPRMNSIFSYDLVARDIDDDQDMDLLLAGTPTGLVWVNDGTGKFEEKTFLDDPTGAGLLPFTSYSPIFSPVASEAIECADLDGVDPAGQSKELMISGYHICTRDNRPPNSGNGVGTLAGPNEAIEWHMLDSNYPHQYTAQGNWGEDDMYSTWFMHQGATSFVDRTLTADFDRNGRFDVIGEVVRAADLDGDGDQDLVLGRRSAWQTTALGNGEDPDDPTDYSTIVSLFMYEAGAVADETVSRLPAYAPGTPGDLWETCGPGVWEQVGLADFDSDGDQDILLAGRATVVNASNPYKVSPKTNLLLVNMGGDQWTPGGKGTGHFEVAPYDNQVQFNSTFPLANVEPWKSTVYSPERIPNPNVLELCDINGDDEIDLLMTGIHDPSGNGGRLPSVVLALNDPSTPGLFTLSAFKGVVLDGWVNSDPTAMETPTALVVEAQSGAAAGDFDHDGDYDVVLLGMNGKVHRYLENKMSDTNDDDRVGPGDPPLTFEDRTSTDTASQIGTASRDAIDWVHGWTATQAAVADFDGDGVHDLYVANQERNAQDDLLLSTVDVPAGVPSVTSVEPPSGGVITGEYLRLIGTNLGNVHSIRFWKWGQDDITIALDPNHVSANEVMVKVPADASFGPQKVILIGPSVKSNAFTVTHLNAVPTGTASFPGGNLQFTVTDPEQGVTHFGMQPHGIELSSLQVDENGEVHTVTTSAVWNHSWNGTDLIISKTGTVASGTVTLTGNDNLGSAFAITASVP